MIHPAVLLQYFATIAEGRNCKKQKLLLNNFICIYIYINISTGKSLYNKSILDKHIAYSCIVCIICTSSTAQGGGGSFKNRKAIGEIGCCESGMAERIR